MARQEWIAASAEILRTPVTDAIPVPRRRAGAWLLEAAGVAIFAAAVVLQFFVLPRLYFLVSLAVLASIMLTVAGRVPRFVAMTRDGHLWMLTATRWFSRPLAPIGPLDPFQVSQPQGLFRLKFVIDGARHEIAIHHKARFREMLETARRLPRH